MVAQIDTGSNEHERDGLTAERIAVQLPRARCNERIKKPTISRAQRSAGTAGWAAESKP
jgi:hypothetical protein